MNSSLVHKKPIVGSSFQGVVRTGHKRGRILGFPTANLAVDADADMAQDGVYSCIVTFPPASSVFGATVSIGYNPTFDDVTERRIEVHLHDLDADIYGATIFVTIVERLRDMVRFESARELIAQTARDVQSSRMLLAKLGVGAAVR